MWRRLNREDLGASNPLVSSRQAPFLRLVWSVYDHYVSPTHHIGEDGGFWRVDRERRYLRASEEARVKKRYEPLVDTPHLFLEFARLVEDRNAPAAMQEWINRRGLLGLHQNSDSGGSGELLDDIWTHACRARNLLAMYEAALSGDMEKLRQVFDPETGSWPAGPGLMPVLSEEIRVVERGQAPTQGDDQQGRWKHRERMRTISDTSDVHYVKFDLSLDDFAGDVDALAEVAMRIVIERVQDALPSLVRPSFGIVASPTERMPRRWWEPELLTRSWVPVNLLGAMYLQFYWVMTSSGDLSRCKHCDQIISRAPSVTGDGKTRKPRNDKEFCNDRCRYNYHYHNRIKPAREGKSQSRKRPLR